MPPKMEASLTLRVDARPCVRSNPEAAKKQYRAGRRLAAVAKLLQERGPRVFSGRQELNVGDITENMFAHLFDTTKLRL